jgi:probable HAF family extracellular repeat protein
MRYAVTAMVVVALGLCPVGAWAAKPGGGNPPPAPAYMLRMLANNLGGTWSEATDINNLGDVLGSAEDALGASVDYVSTPETRAAGVDMVGLRELMVLGGHFVPTEPRQGWLLNHVGGINDSRKIAAIANFLVDGVNQGQRFVVLQLAVDGQGVPSIASVTELPFALPHSGIRVSGINNDGDVLARASLPIPGSPGQTAYYNQIHAAEVGWTDTGVVTNLTDHISDRNEFAEVFLVTGDGRRTQYNVLTGTVAGTVTLKGTYKQDPAAFCYGVNAAGLVCGAMNTGRSDQRAFLYAGGVMKNLGNLTSATSWNDSWGNAVNASGNVAGTSMTGTTPTLTHTGLLYVHATGATHDIANCLSGADRTTYTGLLARGMVDINDFNVACGPGGDIVVGTANKRAYLLVPGP